MKHIYNTDTITTNAGNMIQTLFCVKTVFLGAGGPSVFYFTKYGPAAAMVGSRRPGDVK